MSKINFSKKHKLCYVKKGVAYFTNLSLDEQWGDDWDDVPYECNAEEPYWDEEGQIIKLMFLSPNHEEPCEGYCNSPYSVSDINHLAHPWLSDRYSGKHANILAGCTMEEFCDLIEKAGGMVFFPKSMIE